MNERKVWTHWQNLNERPGDRGQASGHPFWNGRAWLHYPDGVLSAQWVFGKLDFGIGLSVDFDEPGVHWHVKLPLCSLYWGVESRLLGRLFTARGLDYLGRKARAAAAGGNMDYVYEGKRVFRLSVHSGTLWWSCWEPDGIHRATDPKWMHCSINVLDSLLGREKHAEEVLASRDIEVPMPEGKYPAKALMIRRTYTRPRWPRSRVLTTCSIDIPKGIPVPGKGENSYDCGPDATYGLSCPARNIEEAIGSLVSSVLHDRQRRIGTHLYTERDKPTEAQA